MARSVIDLAEFEDAPALKALIDEVRQSNEPLTIRSLGVDLVIVSPAPPKRRLQKGEPTSEYDPVQNIVGMANSERQFKKGDPITEDDPIWNIVGMGASDGPGDVALNHDKYLAEAYLDRHEDSE